MNATEGPNSEARILDAAINLFGKQGFVGTRLREVAAEAGVSQGLVVHHFGSKEALRRACDRHVAAIARDNKSSTRNYGPRMDPFRAIRQVEKSRPLLRYLARALIEGGEQTNELVDEFVADAEEYMREAEQAGYVKPSQTPRERTVVLLIFSMGALAMHAHLHRLLGVDLLDENAPPENMAPYLRPMLELFVQGLLEEGALDRMADLFDVPETLPTDDITDNNPRAHALAEVDENKSEEDSE